jgi:hypothetical protein
VQVARLLDVLTTESHVLEAQLERQLEAQLAALAGVHARSSSRLQENSPPPPRTNTSYTNGASTRTSPASAAAPSPHPSNNGDEHGGLGGADVGETHQNLSLREKVEMREAAARAEAAAAAAAMGTVLNGDNKLVSLLQEWATLRDSRAALRRAVVVEDGYPDEAGDVRYESSGSSRRRSGSLGPDMSYERLRSPYERQRSPYWGERERGRSDGAPGRYGDASILGTGGRPMTSRGLKRVVLEQWVKVLSLEWGAGESERASGGDRDRRGRGGSSGRSARRRSVGERSGSEEDERERDREREWRRSDRDSSVGRERERNRDRDRERERERSRDRAKERSRSKERSRYSEDEDDDLYERERKRERERERRQERSGSRRSDNYKDGGYQDGYKDEGYHRRERPAERSASADARSREQDRKADKSDSDSEKDRSRVSSTDHRRTFSNPPAIVTLYRHFPTALILRICTSQHSSPTLKKPDMDKPRPPPARSPRSQKSDYSRCKFDFPGEIS